MKKIFGGLFIVLGLIILFYGSIKLHRANSETPATTNIEGVVFEYTSPDESLGKKSVNIGLMSLVAGVVIFFIPSRKKRIDT